MGSTNKIGVVVTLRDGRVFDGDVLENDEKADLAAVKIEAVSTRCFMDVKHWPI